MAMVEPTEKMQLRQLKNVKFLDSLRQHVLLGSNKETGRTQIEDVLLIRWILRVIHHLPNSKNCTSIDSSRMEQIYTEFVNAPFKWKPSE